VLVLERILLALSSLPSESRNLDCYYLVLRLGECKKKE
jgi:hypothetical protein